MVEKQGVGSIWNKGNWHWEERNYKDFAIDWLTKEWTKIVETTEDARISIYEVKSLTGSASVTIRKQKQIFMYEFEAELYFKAVHLSDDRQDVMGRLKIHEFN
jgi:activator of HSP90 ATPase